MKRYLVIFSLLALSFAYQTSYAQEIPDEIKAKIIEVADAKKLSKDQRNEWITRQIESWMVVTAAQFDLPKKDVDKLKAEAQEKYPWVYSKQETYIMAQAESLQEINQLKSSFDKGEFDALMAVYQKKYNGDYKKIAEQLYSDVEIKAEIRDMQIEGMDKAMLDVTKKVLASQYPGDLKAQLNALKKQADMMSLAVQAKEEQEAEEKETSQPKEVSRTEMIEKAEAAFKASTLIIAGESKTGTGLVIKVKNVHALIFPAEYFNTKGRLSVSTISGEEGSISLKRVYSAKNMPLMMAILDEIPFGLTPVEFASNDELKGMIGKPAVVVGFYGEALRPVAMNVSKIIKDTIKMVSPINYTYNQGTLILNPATYRPVAICVAGEKEFPNFDYTSSRLVNSYERYMEKVSRYLTAYRLDVPISWVQVRENKMEEQMGMLENFRDINESLLALISGSFDDAKKKKYATSICSKYEKVLSISMDISRLKMEYRSYITSLINVLRRPLAQVRLNDVYANLRNDLGFHIRLAQEMDQELKKELKNGSHTLAPKEFQKKFGDN